MNSQSIPGEGRRHWILFFISLPHFECMSQVRCTLQYAHMIFFFFFFNLHFHYSMQFIFDTHTSHNTYWNFIHIRGVTIHNLQFIQNRNFIHFFIFYLYLWNRNVFFFRYSFVYDLFVINWIAQHQTKMT